MRSKATAIGDVIQMKRMATQTHVFACCYLTAAVSGATLYALADIFYLVAAFRPDRNPELVVLLNDMAWTLAARPDLAPTDAGTAVRFAGHATKWQPAIGGFWNTLGLAHYRAGDRKAAREALAKSMELNAGGEVSEHFTTAERRVRLVRGEAHFTVTKDAARPFVVEAGAVRLRALGTAFNVRFEPSAVEVLVTHGRVQVEPPGDGDDAADRLGGGGRCGGICENAVHRGSRRKGLASDVRARRRKITSRDVVNVNWPRMGLPKRRHA